MPSSGLLHVIEVYCAYVLPRKGLVHTSCMASYGGATDVLLVCLCVSAHHIYFHGHVSKNFNV